MITLFKKFPDIKKTKKFKTQPTLYQFSMLIVIQILRQICKVVAKLVILKNALLVKQCLTDISVTQFSALDGLWLDLCNIGKSGGNPEKFNVFWSVKVLQPTEFVLALNLVNSFNYYPKAYAKIGFWRRFI